MTVRFTMIDPRMSHHDLGLIPEFLNEDDPRPAREQFDVHYQHGGGWHSFEGFKHMGNFTLQYPGDPLIMPLAVLGFRDEFIAVYPHAWVAIWQKDQSFEISRMD